MKRIIIIPLFILFGNNSFSQPEIPIDSSLKNSSEKWGVKIKQKGFTGNRPSAIAFGSVKTLSTDAGKSKRIGKEKDGDLFWRTITSEKSRECNMTILYNDTDTVLANMLVVTQDVSRGRNIVGTVLNVNSDEAYKSSSWAKEVSIQMPGDSLWQFTTTGSSLTPSDYSGKLQAGYDSFLIRSIDNFSDASAIKKMFAIPAAGFVIFYEGKQLAALQTIIKQKVWLSKEVDDLKKKVLTSLIAALFATTKLNYGNNPADN